MIFLLDIILGLNLIWAYKSFKSIVSPPVLVGVGMFIASVIATEYYKAWELDKFCWESVIFLGVGTLFFTFSCLLFRKNVKQLNSDKIMSMSFNIGRLKICLVFMIVLGLLAIYLKIKAYSSYYGNMSISELIFANREDQMTDNYEFRMPIYIRFFARVIKIFLYCFSWVFSIAIFSPKKDKNFIILTIIYFIVSFIDGLFDGFKASAIERLMIVATIFVFVFQCKKKKLEMNKRMLLYSIIAFIIFVSSFEIMSVFIGRGESTNRKGSSRISEYIGAEIKNFDMYMYGRDGNQESNYFGGYSFAVIYRQLGIKTNATAKFQYVGINSLGNVYTQAFYFHKDFGDIGVFIMTFLVAMVSMFFYNKSLSYFQKPNKQNTFLYLYSNMTMPLFMSFFASRFTERIVNTQFLKDIGYVIVVIIIFDKVFLIKNQIQNELHIIKAQ